MTEDLKIEISDRVIDGIAGIEVAESALNLVMESLSESMFKEWSAIHLAVLHLETIRKDLLSMDKELLK